MISVIVCTYNRDKYLPKMLESAAAQTCKKEEFELVLVNNKSTDTTEEICREFEKNNTTIRYFNSIKICFKIDFKLWVRCLFQRTINSIIKNEITIKSIICHTSVSN